MKSIALILGLNLLAPPAMATDFNCNFSAKINDPNCAACGSVGLMLTVTSQPSEASKTTSEVLGRFNAAVETENGKLVRLRIQDHKSRMIVGSDSALSESKSVEIADPIAVESASLNCSQAQSLPMPGGAVQR